MMKQSLTVERGFWGKSDVETAERHLNDWGRVMSHRLGGGVGYPAAEKGDGRNHPAMGYLPSCAFRYMDVERCLNSFNNRPAVVVSVLYHRYGKNGHFETYEDASTKEIRKDAKRLPIYRRAKIERALSRHAEALTQQFIRHMICELDFSGETPQQVHAVAV